MGLSEPNQVQVEVSGGALSCFRFGPAGGVPVLAIHGITSTSRVWVAVAQALGERAEVIAPDLRGRGRSNTLLEPLGVQAHVEDMLAIIDQLELERPLVAGHSLGAFIAAELAADHPDRARAVVLVDGGLGIPGGEHTDPQEGIKATLGPALARLQLRFSTAEEYREWWRRHPAIAGSDIDPAVLDAYADHDLVGEEPQLRSSVAEEAVAADAADVFAAGEAAQQLAIAAHLLCAPRGLVDDPNPLQPVELVREWAEARAELRRYTPVPDCNHYSLVLGRRGAASVAEAIAAGAAR